MKSFVICSGLLLSGSVFAANLIDKDSPNRIANQYIITLKADEQRGMNAVDFVAQEAQRLTQNYGVTVMQQYTEVFSGFAVKADEEQLAALLQDGTIERVEANKKVYASATVQNAATWGIDRVDSRSGTDGKYTYSASGKGVHAYIIDTGTRLSHSEFTGRTGESFSSVNDGKGAVDCHGHGTHVSATIGGTIYGVAKDVTIHGVRVLGCDGSGDDAGVIAGIDWVAKNAIKPAVANMSLGGEASAALDDAVSAAIKAGVVFVVAAGNEFADACNVSPARVPDAITVGATNKSNWKALYSNWGKCLDIFAPGTDITSAWKTNDKATSTISGTSMASPHVAGVVAIYLERNPNATPAEIDAIIKANATPNAVTWPGNGSPNLLIYTNP